MANVLDLELNVQPMVTAAAQADRALDQVGRGAQQMGQRLDTGVRSMASFTVNSLQAINNASNMARTFVSLSQNSANFSQAIGSAGVELGLLAGNFIHLYNAAQQAGGPRGIAGVWALLRANPLVSVIGTLTIAAQAMALFSGRTSEAAGQINALGRLSLDLGRGRGSGAGIDALSEAIQQAAIQREVLGPLQGGLFGAGKVGGDVIAKYFPTSSIAFAAGADRAATGRWQRYSLQDLEAIAGQDAETRDLNRINEIGISAGLANATPLYRAQYAAQQRFKNESTKPATDAELGQVADFTKYTYEVERAATLGRDLATSFLVAFDPSRVRNFTDALREGLQAAVSVLFQRGIGSLADVAGNLFASTVARPVGVITPRLAGQG